MSILDLLTELRKKDIQLHIDGDRLRVNAPDGALTTDLLEALKQRKYEVIAFLNESTEFHWLPRVVPIPRDKNPPLSFSQERLWFLYQLEPQSAAYSMPSSIRLKGKLDRTALKQTLVELTRRHETLRTTFKFVEDHAEQVIASEPTVSLTYEDLRKLPEDIRESEIHRLTDEQSRRPFDLVSGPLLRITLYQIHDQDHLMHINMHHIISDYLSFYVMSREFAEFYNAFASGRTPQLPELPVQYADFAYCQRRWLHGEVLAKHLAYWKEKLGKELPNLDLPTDLPRSAVQTHRGAKESLSLSHELVEALKGLSRREEMTLFMTLLAAFKILLYRLTTQEDILVGTPIAGRNRVELEGLIGFFINTIVMRTDLSGNPTFEELLKRVRETSLGAYGHQEMPFEKLVEELSPERDLSRTPLFQVFFNHVVVDDNHVELPGLTIEILWDFEAESKFDMTLYVVERKGEIVLTALHNANLFCQERMSYLLEQYRSLLEQIIVEPGKPIQSYSLVTPRSHSILPDPGEFLDEPPQALVTDMFSTWAKQTPEQSAVTKGDQFLTYKELSERALILAGALQLNGVKQGDIVAVYGSKSFGLIVSMMAVLYNGCVLLPIDENLPSERQRLIIREAGATTFICVVTRATDAEWLEQNPDLDVRFIEVDTGGFARVPLDFGLETISLPEVSINEPAYVFFTSGTTGIPKGVLGSHKGLSHFLTWQRETFGINSEDRVAQFTSLSFDPVLREIFLPLISGATLCLPVGIEILASNDVLSWLQRERISILHTVPTLAQSWLTTATAELPPGTIRCVFFAGEPLTDDLVQKWKSAFPRSHIVNLYGPTETTLAKCFYTVRSDNVHPGVQPLGSPLPQTQALVLSRDNQLCGIGEPGEIVLRTPFRSLGYINNDEENLKRFVKNPFRDDDTDLVYFTGDRGRFRPDGMIEFLGRLDDQIKIHGVRVEPNEIAVTLAKHPMVDSCFVMSREDNQGYPSLVAYVVVAERNKTTVPELRTYLKRQLPATMVPEAFVFIDALPLTPNGKIDRRALPAPDKSKSDFEEAFVAARTQSEELIADIWSDVLGREHIGVCDNFFELGGHSLLVMQVISRMREVFQVELPLRALFEAPTVAELAGCVETARGSKEGLQYPPLRTVRRDEELVLSLAQQRLWFLHHLEPESVAYSMPTALRVKGFLREDALKRAFIEIARRHESLRTTFGSVDGKPVLRIEDDPSVAIETIDLRHLSEPDRNTEAKRLVNEDAEKPFDLGRGPLFRVLLLRLGDGDNVIHINMHHIISDFWSFGVLTREVSALYTSLVEGETARLRELPIQYVDFAYWQRQWLQGDVLNEQLQYWTKKLGGDIPVLDLPTDRPRPAVQTYRGARQSLVLSRGLADSIRNMSRREGGTLFMTLLTVFKTLLYRLTGQEDILVGTPVVGRNRVEFEALIGFFMSTIVIRTDLSGAPTFRELLARVRETALEAYTHQDMPFDRLVEELAPKRDLSRTPLFQVFFNHIVADNYRIELPGLEVEVFSHLERESKFDMTLYVGERDGEITLTCLYNADLFNASRIAVMLDQYQGLLRQIVDNPRERVARYALLTPSQQKDLPDPRTPLISQWTGHIHERFSEQARRVPEHTAVIDASGNWSYNELERYSNQLARHLVSEGVQVGDTVAIRGQRSAGLVVALLGVLKAGAAFLILDSRYPVSRVAKMLEEASPSGWVQVEARDLVADELHTWLNQSRLACRLTIPRTKKAMEDFLQYMSSDPPEGGVGPDDTAYITFTSGTTGRPKGIVGTHRPLAHFLEWHCREFGLKESDRFSMLSGLSHDPLLRDIFTPLWLGATLCIPDPDEMLIPHKLRAWMRTEQISVAHITPALGQLLSDSLGRTGSSNEELPALRYLFFGGDVLTQRHVDKIHWLAPGATCVNYYGATETPQAMGYHVINMHEEKRRPDHIPLGKGIEGVQLLVLNGANQSAGVGELGEIHIRTPYLARCYLNDEELTRDRFIPNPFVNVPGERLYRTGDLGRYLPDGTVTFHGRSDGQVSIRGFRVELKEIEAIVATHPDIRNCAVIARDAESGDRSLTAYVVGNDTRRPDPVQLRQYVGKHLPEYMIPSAFIQVDEIPLTPNGKVDFAAMPEPGFTVESEHAKSYDPPRYPTEQLLVEIWSLVLGVSQIGVHDNFFQLGGHSLMATQITSRIRDLFKLEMPLRAIFETPTIAELAEGIETKIRGTNSAGLALPSITGVARCEDLPLSYSQERMWFLQQLIPEGTAYNMASTVMIDGVLDIDRLKETFQFLAKRHESLRTTFGSRDGQPFQRIGPDPDFLFQIVDLRSLPLADRQSEALRMAREDSRKPFNLDSGPLLRIHVYRVFEDKHILHTTMHHIITDLWSSAIMGREYLTIYQHLSQQGPLELPEKSIDYVDFAVWQRNYLTGEALGRQIAYWKKQLAGLQVLELPTDRPRPAVFSGRGARTAIPLPDDLAAQLKSFSADVAATPFMVLLAAFYTLLSRYTGQEDIAVGVPIANRHRTEIEGIVGTFVNTLVLRIGLTDDLSFRDLVLSVRDTALAAYAHQDLPFEQLVEQLHPARDPSHSPLVQVMFNLANAHVPELSAGGLTFRPMAMDRGAAQFDLTMAIGRGILIEYATDLFDSETIQRMLDHYLAILRSGIHNPDQPVSEISLLSEAEARVILEEWNQTSVDYPSDQVTSRLFEKQAIQHPEALAMICGSEKISYGELNRRANQLARHLLDLGVVPDSFVGIFLERTIDMVVSLLGVMKSGAAYLPMDPAFPSDRIAFMLNDSHTTVVITQSSLLDELPENDARILCIDVEAEKVFQLCADNLKRDLDPESLAYIIYTSGSTGLPKGVQVSHRALVNFLWSMACEPGLTSNDTILAVTTLSFDIAGLELFLPLIVGGKIALANREIATDGHLLAEAMKSSGATVLQATPTSWRMLIEAGWRGDKRLKALVGGEALPRELAAQLLDRCGELWNMYGPTETTIWSTISRVKNMDEPILIGKPIGNTTIYILDKHLRPVAIGVPGGLFIGGEGLARGYLNRDTLNREKFIPNPFCRFPGERIYETGDLARYRPDGNIECLGRLDHQVKIHGYRIELGEIETALADHPEVNKNVVMAREDKLGEKRLVAYIVPEKNGMISSSEIRAHLKRTLPDYMIPSAFVAIDDIPLTPNGKINRLALPIPDSSQLEGTREYVAPCSPLEETLVAIWKEVLEIDHISVHDNFFEIGGHSLLSMQVISRLEKKIGLRINPRELIYQTLGQLASSLEEQKQDLNTGGVKVNKNKLWQSIKGRLFRLIHRQ